MATLGALGFPALRLYKLALPSDLGSLMKPQMTVDRYAEIARSLPPPSVQQIQAFADHVFDAHSWYKHLPILPPGRPFHFFLDPGAGLTRIVRDDGQLGVEPRSNGDLYHHSWFNTEETRARFGYLHFCVSYPVMQYSRPDAGPSLLDPTLGIDVLLPSEVAEVGQTWVSGLIHPLSAAFAGLIARQAATSPPRWPAQDRSQARGREIMERVQALSQKRVFRTEAPPEVIANDPHRFELQQVDWPLHELFGPERRRQRAAMIEAMHRIIALTHQ